MSNNILFLPQFYYIQYPMFKRVIGHLRSRGIDSRLLYIPNISELDESHAFNSALFERDDVPYCEFKLFRMKKKGNSNNALLQMLQYKINCIRLRRYIDALKPDGIVIGSHLGQMYIRYLQILCHKMGIPIISIWNMEIVFSERNRVPNIISTILGVKDVLEWGCYNKYMSGHLFLATGHALKKYMECLGIKGKQIVVTGNPIHDELSDAMMSGGSNESKSAPQERCLNSDHKCVVLLTEAIQDVMGTEYLLNTLKEFKRAFDMLPDNMDIVIKYHPREPAGIRSIYRDIFRGPRYRFADDSVILMNILKGADIAVAHYTSAIETALILGTPCISLNPTGKSEHKFFRNEGSKYLEVSNVGEALKKICLYFSDNTSRHTIEEARRSWLKDNIILDGNNTVRVANCIVKHIIEHRSIN